ncbi:MAG: glycosyltransferase 87 family protein [Dermatophilaceae bacterium]
MGTGTAAMPSALGTRRGTLWVAGTAGAVLLIGYFSVLWWLSFWPLEQQDAQVYLRAGRDVLQGQNIYQERAALPYTYPPLWALLCAPLGWLPPMVATVVFALTSVALCWWVLARLRPNGSQAWIWLGFAALSAPVGRSLYLGQVNPGIVVLLLADAIAIPVALRGITTGLAAAIKVTPAFMALTFVTQRDWRAVARCVGAFALVTGLAFVALPDASREYWGGLLWESSRVGDLAYPDNQSLLGLFSRLLDPAPASILAKMASLVVVLACWRAVVVHQRRGSTLVALAAAGIGSVLISPVSWSHHWIWLVVLSAVAWAGGRRAWSLVLLAPLVATPLWLAEQVLPNVAMPYLLRGLLLSLPTLVGLAALAALTRVPARPADASAEPEVPVMAGDSRSEP